MKTSGRQFITRSKKGLTSPCKSCRRRIRPELLDKTYLCNECKNDPAAKWLAARTPQPAPTDAPAKHKPGSPSAGEECQPGDDPLGRAVQTHRFSQADLSPA